MPSAEKNVLYGLIAACFFAAAAFFAFNSYIRHFYPRRFPPANEIKEVRNSAVEDIVALSFGMRRLAADLWFIRLMQYYGTPELHEGEEAGDEEHVCRHGLDYGSGEYPDFVPMTRHIMGLDPYFTNAVVYSAASLAFNMNKPDAALGILGSAFVYSPKEWKLVSIAAAIGYSRAENPEKVAETLDPLIREKDCPVMVKQLAAFLNKKIGDYEAAYRIYSDILAVSKEKYYIENSKREIEKLEKLIKRPSL